MEKDADEPVAVYESPGYLRLTDTGAKIEQPESTIPASIANCAHTIVGSGR